MTLIVLMSLVCLITKQTFVSRTSMKHSHSRALISSGSSTTVRGNLSGWIFRILKPSYRLIKRRFMSRLREYRGMILNYTPTIKIDRRTLLYKPTARILTSLRTPILNLRKMKSSHPLPLSTLKATASISSIRR